MFAHSPRTENNIGRIYQYIQAEVKKNAGLPTTYRDRQGQPDRLRGASKIKISQCRSPPFDPFF